MPSQNLSFPIRRVTGVGVRGFDELKILIGFQKWGLTSVGVTAFSTHHLLTRERRGARGGATASPGDIDPAPVGAGPERGGRGRGGPLPAPHTGERRQGLLQNDRPQPGALALARLPMALASSSSLLLLLLLLIFKDLLRPTKCSVVQPQTPSAASLLELAGQRPPR